MIKRILSLPALTLLLIAAGCGSQANQREQAIKEKKEKIAKLKAEQEKTGQQLTQLQDELSKIDTSAATQQQSRLVAVQTIGDTAFSHFIELQGKVDAKNISFVTPRGQGGQVKAVLVNQGDRVSKGQLLLRLDNAVQQQSLVASREGLAATRTQLANAKDLYQRYKNLWDNHIGTEVQLINARTQVKVLEDQLQAQQANVQTVAEQLNTSNVYADVSGVADVVNIRVGETFSPTTAAMSGIKIVNTSSLKAVSNIPENYAASVKVGMPVVVKVPDINKTFETKVSFLSASIDPLNRGFVVEAQLPNDASLKPNQIATLNLKDYADTGAIVIPLNTMQTDQNGKFVMVAVSENGKLVARKRPVTIGKFTGNQLEITSGLKQGDVLITEGYQTLYDGVPVTTK